MKFFIITGPQAVGKMSVGMALAKRMNYRLFHNHMTIELAKDIYGELHKDAWGLVASLRKDIFESVSQSDLEGFIFTYVWAFNYQSDHDYVNNLIELFESRKWEAYIVELEASVEKRLERNVTPLRLEMKASKRDVEWSNNELVTSLDKYRLQSEAGEITHKNYIRINNENLQEDEVVDRICQAFKL